MSLLRPWLVAAAALALFPPPLAAQTGKTPAAAEPKPAAAPAPPAQETVPVADIVARAQVVSDEAQALATSLARANDRQQLDTDLTHLTQRVEPRLQSVSRELLQTPALATLTALEVEWRNYASQLEDREGRLQKLIAGLQQQSDELEASRGLWQRTHDQLRHRDVPPAIRSAVDESIQAIRQGSARVQGSLNAALVLQSQYADLHATVQQTLDSIGDARARVVANLLVRDEPPIWDVAFTGGLRKPTDWQLGAYLEGLRSDSALYAAQHPDEVAVNLLVFALLIWALRRARAGMDGGKGPDGEAGPDAGFRLATRHPVAVAALFGWLATPYLHADMPRSLLTLVRLLLAAPAVIVLRPFLLEAFRAPLYLLMGFFVMDQLRAMLTGTFTPVRAAFVLEMVLLCAVLAALLRPRRLAKLPVSTRGNAWLRVLSVWIRLCAVGAAAATLGAVAGYMRFATLVGGGVLGSGYATLSVFALTRIAEGLTAAVLRSRASARVRMLDRHRELFLHRSRLLLRVGGMAWWLLLVGGMFGVRDAFFAGVGTVLGTHFGYGAFEVTLGGVAVFGVTVAAAVWVSRSVRFVLEEEVFPRVSLARGVPFALSALARYAILLIGFLVGLSALGFDLDRITILLSAFGVGIGFGLQTVVNNFVSGLILLFERPIQVGDQVQLEGVEGKVMRIGIRASTVRSWDGADVLVPNSTLVSNQVVNWTLSDRLRRIILPVGVAYGSDLHVVIDLLRGAVEKHPDVCAYPAPMVLFDGFGDSSLNFQVRIWTERSDSFSVVRSEVGVAIHDALRDANIEIPFPQRTLHLRRDEPPPEEPPEEGAAVRPGSEPGDAQSKVRP